MGSPWHEIALGALIQVKHGWPFVGNLYSNTLTGRPIVVSIGNFRYTGGFRFDETTTREYRGEYPPDFELRPGEILVVMTCQTPGGEILGIPARVPDDGRIYLHNQRMGKVVVVRPDLVRDDYLYWLFLWREFNEELVASSTGTKILHTAPSRIEAFRFQLPSVEEQGAIAEVLNALAEKIEVNRRMNGALEAIAQAIFRSWFVDFDPVAAKAAGRQPVGMDGEIAALFPAGFVDSSVGPIPDGWEVSTVGSIGENRREIVQPEAITPGTRYIGLEHMPRGSIVLDEGVGAVGLMSAKAAFRRGDVLFGKLRPYFRKVGVALWSGVCSTDIVVVTPADEPWRSLLLGYLSSKDFVDYADGASGGTRMPRVSWEDMARYTVVLPGRALADALNSVTSVAVEQIAANVEQNRTLAELRDMLLPKLLSGEVRLREAEKVLEQAGA